jgi:hypothetical protein
MTNGYRSRLANELQAFLEFKRSLGIQYDSAEWVLRRFDRFVAQTFKGRKPIDLKMAIEGWLATFHCRPVTITNNFLVLRKFCLFLRRRDPNGFVPDRDLARASTNPIMSRTSSRPPRYGSCLTRSARCSTHFARGPIERCS